MKKANSGRPPSVREARVVGKINYVLIKKIKNIIEYIIILLWWIYASLNILILYSHLFNTSYTSRVRVWIGGHKIWTLSIINRHRVDQVQVKPTLFTVLVVIILNIKYTTLSLYIYLLSLICKLETLLCTNSIFYSIWLLLWIKENWNN